VRRLSMTAVEVTWNPPTFHGVAGYRVEYGAMTDDDQRRPTFLDTGPYTVAQVTTTTTIVIIIITVCECGVVMRSVASVCVSVCVCAAWVLTVTSQDLETSFFVCRYIFTTSRSSLYIKVIRSGSRSQGQKGQTSVTEMHTFACSLPSIERQSCCQFVCTNYR